MTIPLTTSRVLIYLFLCVPLSLRVVDQLPHICITSQRSVHSFSKAPLANNTQRAQSLFQKGSGFGPVPRAPLKKKTQNEGAPAPEVSSSSSSSSSSSRGRRNAAVCRGIVPSEIIEEVATYLLLLLYSELLYLTLP